MPGDEDSIADDELLYRRIPVNPEYYNPKLSPPVDRLAFLPINKDPTGISLSRKKYKTPQQAAKGREGKRYYIAVLQVGDLRARGLKVVPNERQPGDGHTEIPLMQYDKRDSDEVQEAAGILASLCKEVLGPFP